jgi:hypothetical protein
MFRPSFPVVCAALLSCLAPLGGVRAAQTRIEVTDLASHSFSADFPSGGKLRLRVRSGDVRIIGTDQNKISIELSGERANDASDMRARLDHKDGAADLRVSGGPRNGVTITIRIPANTDLYARIPFGDVHVQGVAGNQDVAIHAGDLTLRLGNAADYARIDASVTAGDLDARPFGESHGGLFRSFHREGSGKYRLHVHVGAGDLVLE